MNFKFYVILLVMCILLLGGCVSHQETKDLLSPIPMTSPLPTPSSSTVATVHGVLISMSGTEKISGIAIYLARVIRAEDNSPILAVVEDTSPTTFIHEDGSFTFTEVPSNTYGLAISTPSGPFLIQGPDGSDLIIAASGGAVVELGEISVSLP